MINGVLTERSVADVVPILETNQEGLRKTLEELVKQYKSRQEEMEGWKVCFSFFVWGGDGVGVWECGIVD